MSKTTTIITVLLFICSLQFRLQAAKEKVKSIEKPVTSCGEVKFIMGRMEIKKKDKSVQKAALKTKIQEGDILKTYKNTSCMLELTSGARFHIKGEGVMSIDKVLLQDQENNSKVKVLFGSMKVKLEKLGKKNFLDIETPTAVVGVRGTYFETQVQEELTRVKVFSGLIIVRNINEKYGVSKEVKAGFSCLIEEGQEAGEPIFFTGEGDGGDDTTAPIITVFRPASFGEITPSEEYDVMFMVNDSNLDSVYVNGEQVPDAASNAILHYTLKLYPGKNTVYVEAWDKNGNYAINSDRVIEWKAMPPGPPER
ncbi:MAG: FecR domain-containing protein [bacterium]|nr:FecR domain-containing protein [bacterium]